MNSALILAYVGVALMVGLAGIASAVGTAICGQTAVGAMKKNGGAFGSYMILSALPGSQGLYGFVGYFMVSGLIVDGMSMLAGIGIFGAGLLMAIVCLSSALFQAKVCANGISAIGAGHNAFFTGLDGQLYTAFHIQTNPDKPSGDRRTVIGKVEFSEKNGENKICNK